MKINTFLLTIMIFSSLYTAGQNSHNLVERDSIDQIESGIPDNAMMTLGRSGNTNQRTNPKSRYRKPIVINGPIGHAKLKTSNGCGVGNFIIPSSGNALLGIPPTIGALMSGGSLPVKVIDTIPGVQIKGVAFRKDASIQNNSVVAAWGNPFVVISDTGMFTYDISYDFAPGVGSIAKVGSQFIPNVIKMATQVTLAKTNPIVLFVEDSINYHRLLFFDYPGLQEQFSVAFDFEPEIFEVVDSALFVTGQDSTGNYMLYNFSAFQDTLFSTFTLNDATSNAQELLTIGDSIFILSSPGDSVTMLTTINKMNGTIFQNEVYPKSGSRATYNDYKGDKLFTFQPISDIPDTLMDKQILILDPVTQALDTLMLNLKLDVFKYPQQESSGFGMFNMDWIGASWENGLVDTVYLSQFWTTYKIETGPFPQHINATYGCWSTIPENEHDRIKFDLYPNPTSSDITIKLTGLEKGRKYKLDIRDLSGKVHYATSLMAYQEFQIPVGTLAKGVYFLRLETGKNIISQRLILQ